MAAGQDSSNLKDIVLPYGMSGSTRRRPRRFLALVLIFAGVVATLVVPGLFLMLTGHPRVGRHVSAPEAQIEDLPAIATDVCYAMKGAMGPSSAYEFTISEAGFLDWARNQGWTVQPITSPVQIHRYGVASWNTADPQELQVDTGYFFEWVDPQASDNRLDVAYDSASKRAYWYRSYR